MVVALRALLLVALRNQIQTCAALSRSASSGASGAGGGIRSTEDVGQDWEDSGGLVSTAKVMHLLSGGPYEAVFYAPKGKPRPVLLFLHDGPQREGGIASMFAADSIGEPPMELEAKRAPLTIWNDFAVIAPHATEAWNPEKLHAFLDYLALTGLSLDMTRVVVTGHGKGGVGALQAAALEPHRFAAVVPIACCYPSDNVTSLVGVPIWAFHGKNDVVAPARCSEYLVSGLQAMGSQAAKLTLFENAPHLVSKPLTTGHGSMLPAYASKALYQWLLQQRISPERARARPWRPTAEAPMAVA